MQMPVDEKVNELFHLAEELDKWVKRATNEAEGARPSAS